MAIRIAAVGEIVEDRYLGEPEQHFLGGISANFARAAIAAGARATLFSAVGDDDTGKRLRQALRFPHVLQTLPGASAVQKIIVRPGGERQFCGYDAGVLTRYTLTGSELAGVNADFDVVHVPIQPETEHLLTGIVRPEVVADFSIDSASGDDPRAWCGPHLQRLHIAFIGGHAHHLQPLRALGARTLIVLTCGAQGAYAIAGDRVLHQPTLATRIVDTTGCGDAFAGAFSAVYFSGGTVEQALQAGAERAAIVASRLGGGE